jgi:DNA-binding beta-propeller fold protein YncE
MLHRLLFSACVLGLTAALAPMAAAQQEAETVLENLTNPCGIAVQPETGHVFVSDSGAGRIVRVVDGKAQNVVTDFPLDVYGKGPKYDIGPLGLAFLDKDTLVVGGGGLVDTDELVRIYTVPAAGEPAIKADAMKASLGPLPHSEELKAEGNYYGVAVNKSGIYVTCNGDDTKGWVSMASLDGTKFGEFKRFIATKELVQVDAPVAIATSPQGVLVVGQMGEITIPEDGLLTFYHAETGKMLMNLETGLFDITGLAYSPKGHLYATDFAWMAPEEGGLFRLDSKGEGQDQTISAVKITGLDKPTSLAFGDDGALYIATIGASDDESEKTGKLIKLAPGL